jgi:hypothetical protein
VQPTWPAIVERSLYVSVRSAEAIALRHLYALAEATKLRGDGDVEVRWVAVPQTWRPLNDQFFDEATMRLLSDEGRRLGPQIVEHEGAVIGSPASALSFSFAVVRLLQGPTFGSPFRTASTTSRMASMTSCGE